MVMMSFSRTDSSAANRRPDGVLQRLLEVDVVAEFSGVDKEIGGCGQECVRLRKIVQWVNE